MTNHSSTCQEPKPECIQKKHTSLRSFCFPSLLNQSNATAMSAKKLALEVAPVFLNLPVPMIALQGSSVSQDPHGRKYHSVKSLKFMCCIFDAVHLEKAYCFFVKPLHWNAWRNSLKINHHIKKCEDLRFLVFQQLSLTGSHATTVKTCQNAKAHLVSATQAWAQPTAVVTPSRSLI